MDQYLLEKRDNTSETDKYNMLSHLLIMGYDVEDDQGNSMSSKKFSANFRALRRRYED